MIYLNLIFRGKNLCRLYQIYICMIDILLIDIILIIILLNE